MHIYKSLLHGKSKLMPLLLLMSLCLFGCVVLTSFKSEITTSNEVASTVRQSLIQNMVALQQQAQQLKEALEATDGEQVSLQQVQDALYGAKLAYKKVEYLVEYLDPERAKKINGASLPKVLIEEAGYQTLNFQKPSVRTFPPEGLQVLEELIFAEEVDQDMMKEAVVLAYALEEEVALFAGTLQHQPLTDRQLLESLREELIRIMTMGITGFDAPAAGKEMEHAKVALQPVLHAAQRYEETASGPAKEYSGKAVQHLQQTIDYLQQHHDFETFDRLYFIRELVDPAYAAMTTLQQELLPTAASVSKPVNDHANSLFSADFLQAAYFAKQDRMEQRPELVMLGKVLFFDPVLSANNERSCASCHVPSKAFSDGQARSIAFDFRGKVQRNSPTLLNTIFSNAYFWDSRVAYLQDQVPDVVVNSDEMHGNYEEVVHKLKQSSEYKKLFKRAFSNQSGNDIGTNTVNRAIAAYVQSLVALDSPFDRYMRRETEQLSAAAKRGFNIFMGKGACGTCHFAPTFNGTVPPRYLESETEVLGVTTSADFAHPELDTDLGRAGVVSANAWQHSFKTPTVRNAGRTAPYMHNGAFTTLAEVVEFYDAGGGAGLGLEVPNQTLPDRPLNLTEQDKKDLVSFMESLTDTATVYLAPERLPQFPKRMGLQARPIGGRY